MLNRKTLLAGAATAAATGAAVIGISISSASSTPGSTGTPGSSVAATAAVASGAQTTTPIKHLVVLFDENISFDHYFGTYPYAENKPGEPVFSALPNTPTVNGLNNTLLEANPNAVNPQRLAPSQALTCDQNHAYTPEQQAFDDGLMDQFVQDTTGGGCKPSTTSPNTGGQSNDPDQGNYAPNGIVMDYYDGNTVTALWNYAQHYTLNDNSYDTQFGPSSPGAINVISGNTHGALAEPGDNPETGATTGNILNGTLNGDAEPYFDECSRVAPSSSTGTLPGSGDPAPGGTTGEQTGKNIGDLLGAKGLTWGWFQGGFTPTSRTSSGVPVCGAAHTNIGGATVTDYSEHHEPFQYYQSTSNPEHLAPNTTAQVGTDAPTGVNHQYDLTEFDDAVKAGDMPAVSYLKAPEYEDGHAGYSDPLDEQRFLVDEINRIEQSPAWSSTAIVIAYDDSDGWYDHQMGPIIRGSQDQADALNGTGKCGSASPSISDSTTVDRCGVGPRLPLLVISPWARQNFVDNTFTEQASIPRFIEDNWGLPRVGGESADASAGTLMNAFDFNPKDKRAPAVILNDTSGEVEQTIPATAPSSTSGSSPSTGTGTGSPSSGGSSSGGGSSSTGTGSQTGTGAGTSTGHGTVTTVKITLPKLSLLVRSNARSVRIRVRTRGGSQVATSVRLRLRRGHALLADQAATVRDHRATFVVRRGRDLSSGRYRVTLTIDAAGKVGATTRTVSIR